MKTSSKPYALPALVMSWVLRNDMFLKRNFLFHICLGTDCEYDGIIIAMGTKYEDTTGPVCYMCSCSNTGELDCCQ